MTFLSGTHVSHKLSESYIKSIRKFAKFSEDLRRDNNFELSEIANMNQIPSS